jgi:hypothetical protein
LPKGRRTSEDDRRDALAAPDTEGEDRLSYFIGTILN